MADRPPPPPDFMCFAQQKSPTGPVSTRQLLAALFFRPLDIFGILGHETLLRSALRVLLATALSGVLLALGRIPDLREEVGAWGKWLSSEMGDVYLRDKELAWVPASPLPYSRHFRNWRVNFTSEPVSAFNVITRYGPEPRGLWICPEAIVFWQRTEGREELVPWEFPVEKFAAALPAGEEVDQGIHVPLTGRTLAYATFFMIVGTGVATLLAVMGEVFFYAALFAIIPVLLRGGRGGVAFSRTLIFYLNMSLVPLVVATVYSLVRVPVLDFNTVFALGFMFYLGFIVIGTRVRLARQQKKESRR